MLTFDFEVGLAGEIVALADNAHVPAAIAGLWVLDDEGEKVLILGHAVFLAFVTFLENYCIIVCSKCQAAFALVHFIAFKNYVGFSNILQRSLHA